MKADDYIACGWKNRDGSGPRRNLDRGAQRMRAAILREDKPRGLLTSAMDTKTVIVALLVIVAPAVFVAPVVFVATVGCSDRQEKKSVGPVKSAPAQASDATATTPSVAQHMKEHFSRVEMIRDAVIAGDYAATREPATWLAEHGAPKGIPDPWIPLVTDFRVMAGGLSDAKDVESVATALGPVARSCGGCHTSLKATLTYARPQAPAGDGFKAEMARHKWAAGLLWDGVVVPNADAWAVGAEHFASVALVPESLPADREKGLRELADITRALGTKAKKAADLLERGVVYGELLTTCAKCHALAGK